MASDKTSEVPKIEIESAKKVIKLIKEDLGFPITDTTSPSPQEIISGLTYLSSQNLLKHSDSLNRWTIVIGLSTILLFASAVLQLIKLFCFP